MTNLAANNIFSNIPKTNYLHFFDKGANPSKQVVEFLELSQEEIAKVAGIPKSSVRYDRPLPSELETRLMEIGTICELVAGYFKGDIKKTALWFKIANPLLGNVSPRDMIRFGRYKKLRQFILNSLAGNLP